MPTKTTTLNGPQQLPLSAYLMFFHGDSFVYKGQYLKAQTVQTKNGKPLMKLVVGDYTYLEQNPASSSQYGAMARRGDKILWVIHTPTGKYIGRVINGKLKKL